MNSTIERWITALLSGDYKQGKNFLNYVPENSNEHRFCCLGVLCELEGVEKFEELSSNSYHEATIYYAWDEEENGIFESEGEPPDWWLSQFGISPWLTQKLIQMNDDGVPFREIAAFLEGVFWKSPPEKSDE